LPSIGGAGAWTSILTGRYTGGPAAAFAASNFRAWLRTSLCPVTAHHGVLFHFPIPYPIVERMGGLCLDKADGKPNTCPVCQVLDGGGELLQYLVARLDNGLELRPVSRRQLVVVGPIFKSVRTTTQRGAITK
jgi:hypothetical protein